MQEKLVKNYLFYDKHRGTLYAYTNIKEFATIFRMMRREDIFLEKVLMLSSADLKEIHENSPGSLLKLYKFTIDKREISFPITADEEVNMIHVVQYNLSTGLGILCSKIPRAIFTKEVGDLLKDIGFTSIQKEYADPSAKRIRRYPNYIACFLYLYSNTMKGGELDEKSISVLSLE